MTGDQIRAGNTILRYCGFQMLSEEDGKPTAAAYKLSKRDKEHDPPYLSFNWLEYFSGQTKKVQIEAIRTILEKKMNRIGSQAKLALLPVEEIHRKFEESEENINIDIQHLPDETPEREDPSHCGFLMDIDIDKDEGVVAKLLAQVVCTMKPAKSP